MCFESNTNAALSASCGLVKPKKRVPVVAYLFQFAFNSLTLIKGVSKGMHGLTLLDNYTRCIPTAF